MSDWPTTCADFREMFDAYHTDRRPRGLRGENFMTPDVLGHLLIAGEPVEVSTGSGFSGERVYGLTWGRLPDGTCDPRDRMCSSPAEVREHLMAECGHRVEVLP